MPRKKSTTFWHQLKVFIDRPRVHMVLTLVTELIIIGAPILFALDFVSNKPGIRMYCNETKTFIKENETALNTVFQKTFEEAHLCGTELCSASVSATMLQSFRGTHQMRDFPSTYFVRLQDKEIEKLFLNARFVSSPIVSKGEKIVRAILQGRAFGRCTQGFKLDQDDSTMRYLYDMHAEAEVILPVRIDGKVVGAVVRAWGD